MIAASSDAPAASSGDGGRSLAPSGVPFERGDRFRGHYWCSKGRSELALVIEDFSEDTVEVTAELDVRAGGRTPPAFGSYRMRGTWDARSRTLRLKSDRWLEQPAGHEMVDLTGTVAPSGTISGRVVGSGCTTFSVAPERLRDAAPGR